MRLTQKTRRLFIFPGISHFEGIGQGGISREIPPGNYRPGISRTTLAAAGPTDQMPAGFSSPSRSHSTFNRVDRW